MKIRFSGKSFETTPPVSGWKFTPRPGGWYLAERTLEDGTIIKSRVMATQSNGKIWLHSWGRTYAGEWIKASRNTGTGASPDSDLVARFPGKVRKILVKEGQSVDEGASLLLIEAMKMEFTIKAPSAGKIEKILVTEGEQLLPGKKFLDFSASGSAK